MGYVNILILDDSPLMTEHLKPMLEIRTDERTTNRFRVFAANTVAEADSIMEKNIINVCLLDINLKGSLEDGIAVTKRYRMQYPHVILILFSLFDNLLYMTVREADDKIDKNLPADKIVEVIDKNLHRKMMKSALKAHWPRLRHLLPQKDDLTFIKREFTEDSVGWVEKIITRTQHDKEHVCCNLYHIYEHSNRAAGITLATAIGCGIKCFFCLSKNRSAKRNLTANEIIAQFLHALQSQSFYRFFDESGGFPDTTVYMAGEGDCVFFNPYSTMEATEKIYDATAGDINFVYTTVGHVDHIGLLERVAHLPISVYCSIPTVDQERRNRWQPGTIKHPIVDVLNALENFYHLQIKKRAGKTVDKITIAVILIPGINDLHEELDKFAALLHGRPFKIKVMSLGSDWERNKEKAIELLKIFVSEMEARGVECRWRSHVGYDIWGSCGTLVAKIYNHQCWYRQNIP